MRRSAGVYAVLLAGCAGSLEPSRLRDSARLVYPDCGDVTVAEPAPGGRRWVEVCGERRLFAERSPLTVDWKATFEHPSTVDNSIPHLDVGPPLEWTLPRRADDTSHAVTTLVTSVPPLGLDLTLTALAGGAAYFVVDTPRRCSPHVALWIHHERREPFSAPTWSAGTRPRFAQRFDAPTLEQLGTLARDVEVEACGRRFFFSAQTAEAVRAWVADSQGVAPAP